MSNSNDKKTMLELFVPGRLCLFGEHSDWAGTARNMNSSIVEGRAIVTGIEQGIYANASKSDRFVITSRLPEYEGMTFSCEMDKDKLREAAKQGGFFSYVAGVASYMCEWYGVGGVSIEITKMDLPMKSGLSSSAAICVLVARAFNILYDLHLNTLGVMNIAYWGEQRTPSRCGRLDQACAFGVNPVAMVFDGNEISVDRINVKEPLHYVFADLMAGKDTVRILADLNKAYPFPTGELECKLHEALGEDNQKITGRAMEYISTGQVEKLGELMIEAQKLFDEKIAPMSPKELAAPVLHETLNDENIKKLTFGGKGVGSQGDGTVQFLAKSAEDQKKLVEYLNDVKKMTAYSLTLQPNRSVRKAIIPVAGFGTRMYPATRGIKKEFCPVVDKDGLVKPAILVLLEELDRVDIEEICLILNREEEAYYTDYFYKPLSEEHFKRLPANMQEYERKIEKISRKLRFVYQEEQKGFGHAVYQAKQFAGNDPVLLLLGDTIYSSNTNEPCTKQLLDAYERYGQSMIAIQKVPLNDVGYYGIFAGTWENRKRDLMKVTKIVEKPSVEEAKDYLAVKGREGEESYYAAFGAYVINKDVFSRLDEMVHDNIVNAKGEVELTEALKYVCENKGLMAFAPDGESFDLGNGQGYRNAVANFGK